MSGIIGVVGFGIMGRAIALASVRAGFTVRVFDSRPGAAADGIDKLRHEPGSCESVGSLAELADCALIVEAIAESLAPKHELFVALGSIAPRAILVSNTSTYTPSELSSVLVDRSRLIVGHFFNPAHLVPLVELVPGPETAVETVSAVRDFLLAIGKQPITLRVETPGFVANRIQAAVLRECFSLIEQGVASAEDIDSIVRLSIGPRWAACGPVSIADQGGLDTFVALTDRLFPLLDSRGDAPVQMRDLVRRGELGAKSGSGVYPWSEGDISVARERITAFFELQEELGHRNAKREV